jgi:hypothetical protein
MKHISLLALTLLGLFGCGGSESDSSGSDQPRDITIGPLLLGPFSSEYNDIYSGYWRLTLPSCADQTGFASLGLGDEAIEISTGVGNLPNVLGSIDSEGNLSFEDRLPTTDCDQCDPPPTLSTTGSIDFEAMTGLVRYEVACRTGSTGYYVRPLLIELRKGMFQPNPLSEMARLAAQIQEFIDADNTCTQTSDCDLLDMRPNDVCNLENPVYSTASLDQAGLQALLSEYRHFRRLSGADLGTSTTLCSGIYLPTCSAGTCQKVWR